MSRDGSAFFSLIVIGLVLGSVFDPFDRGGVFPCNSSSSSSSLSIFLIL